jgi:hypothetical protein
VLWYPVIHPLLQSWYWITQPILCFVLFRVLECGCNCNTNSALTPTIYVHVCWAHRFYRRGRRSPSTRKDFVRSATTFYKTFCRTLLIS